MTASRKFNWNSIVFGVAIALIILGAGALLAESEVTLVNIPAFLLILIIIGVGVGIIIRRMLERISPSTPVWVNAAVFAIFFASVTGGTALLFNSLAADKSCFEEMPVVIERKIIKTRHRGGSAGRRSYNPGTPYKVYYLELRFPDGRKREVHPDYKIYMKANKGDSAFIKVGRGALFLPVCDAASLRLKHPERGGRHRKFGYFHHLPPNERK